MAKILIEFYSVKTPENLISLFNERFDEVVFLCSAEKSIPSPRRRNALSEQVKKLLGFPARFCEIKHLSVSSALEALNLLWEDGNEYLIDITGGDEAFLAAAGIFTQQKLESVSLHYYDVPTGKKLFSYPEKQQSTPPFPHYVSVPELLTLNGSAPLSAPSYVFTRGPLKREILRLWSAVRSRPKEWNRFCALDHDQLENRQNLTQKILENDAGISAYQTVSARLKSAGILTHETKSNRRGREVMNFSLKVPEEALFLYDKAGNLLEMYCALCAHDSGLFHDIRVGVMLDWNGTVSAGRLVDPRNEVDLILMRENLPILASCKNTAPQNEHLYEIMIMAKHYGGYFATPALFASGRATETVKKRADEMGIVLIDGIRFKTPEQMTVIMKNTFSEKLPILQK
ncbi:MAG: hypothetical protein E7580_01800 [Ruminococcaceae bacterium]|nr:hypothetical protein [Oscillospiraceae bacterium]